MTEDFVKHLTCYKCGVYLTPKDVGYYGVDSPPRCEACRTVHRNFTFTRIHDVIKKSFGDEDIPRGPQPQIDAYRLLESIRMSSWTAYLLYSGYAQAPSEWSIYNGLARFSDTSGNIVNQRISRFARRYLPKHLVENILCDADLEKFNNVVRSMTSLDNVTWKVLDGEDIRNAYHEGNYAENVGQLHNSCMRYAACQSYFDLYVHNPDVCRLLTAWNEEGELIGRALVWTLTNGEIYLDRIYANDFVRNAFTTYAQEHLNAVHSYDPDSDADYIVQLSHWFFKRYPYCDTMYALNPRTGMVWSNPPDDDLYMSLGSVDGWFGEGRGEDTPESTKWVICGDHYMCDYDGIHICPVCEAEKREQESVNELQSQPASV